MELKFSNDTKFIKFWPLPAEILSATHHYPIHPGHYIPNVPDISVHQIWVDFKQKFSPDLLLGQLFTTRCN